MNYSDLAQVGRATLARLNVLSLDVRVLPDYYPRAALATLAPGPVVVELSPAEFVTAFWNGHFFTEGETRDNLQHAREDAAGLWESAPHLLARRRRAL